MNQITRDELKSKLDRGDKFSLIMTYKEGAFQAAHIPGSISIDLARLEQAVEVLRPDDEIVVYCIGEPCPASRIAYHYLVSKGYSNVRRYAGGIADWHEAGFPLEGQQATRVSDGALQAYGASKRPAGL